MEDHVTQTAQASLMEVAQHPTKALPSTSAQIRIPTKRPVSQMKPRVKREARQVTKEWTTEVAHTDQFSTHLPADTTTPSHLAPSRIQRFHQQIISTLLKKMVELQSAARQKVDCKVADKSSVQQKLQHDHDELWRDMIKPHEERHFQIGRITNYFS